MAQRHVRTLRPVRRFIALSALLAGARGHFVLQRYELFGALTKVAAFAAGSSRWCYTTTPLPATALPRCPQPVAVLPRRPCQQQPHPAEKRTPVWLAIWCTWAGFANSQLRYATFQSTYSYKCTSSLLPPWSRCSDRRKSIGPSAPIAYATSVSPPDEAVAWPRTQVSGAGYGGRFARCRCLVLDMAAAWPAWR